MTGARYYLDVVLSHDEMTRTYRDHTSTTGAVNRSIPFFYRVAIRAYDKPGEWVFRYRQQGVDAHDALANLNAAHMELAA